MPQTFRNAVCLAAKYSGAVSPTREIEENRDLVSPLAANTPLECLCYKSGPYQPDTFPTLHALAIETGATWLTGLNTAETHPFALSGILDNEARPSLEFEAAPSGFLKLLRHVRSRANRYRRMVAA